jgi:hypothetical protein
LDLIAGHVRAGQKKILTAGIPKKKAGKKKRGRFVMSRQEFPAFVASEIAVFSTAFQQFF